MPHLNIEIKARCDEPERLRRALLGQGADCGILMRVISPGSTSTPLVTFVASKATGEYNPNRKNLPNRHEPVLKIAIQVQGAMAPLSGRVKAAVSSGEQIWQTNKKRDSIGSL